MSEDAAIAERWRPTLWVSAADFGDAVETALLGLLRGKNSDGLVMGLSHDPALAAVAVRNAMEQIGGCRLLVEGYPNGDPLFAPISEAV